MEHWDTDDWSRLWWVRAELRWEADAAERADALTDLLERKYPQYAGRPFARVLVLRIVELTGWSGSAAAIR